MSIEEQKIQKTIDAIHKKLHLETYKNPNAGAGEISRDALKLGQHANETTDDEEKAVCLYLCQLFASTLR